MAEDRIDISNNLTKDVFELFKDGKHFNYVITVCDAKEAARYPVLRVG